jgi:hypothetical protein
MATAVQTSRLSLKKLNTTDEFLTPSYLVKELGEFDLDPCSSKHQQYPLAKRSFVWPEEDGLLLPWAGRVFVNPPFSELQKWTERFILHNNGILLVPARIEVSWFWTLWHNCSGFFFTKGPLKYICLSGKTPPGFFGSAFCAIGADNADSLKNLSLRGVIVTSRLISGGRRPA